MVDSPVKHRYVSPFVTLLVYFLFLNTTATMAISQQQELVTFLNSLPNEVLTFFVILSPVKRGLKWAHCIPSSAPQQIQPFFKFPKMTNLVAEILRHEPIFLPFPSLKPQPHS